jgi:tetratricopeptide (TPR) repeat protein
MAKGGLGNQNDRCGCVFIYILSLLLLLANGYALAEGENCRVINIKVAPELALKAQENWQPEFNRILKDCDRIFKKRFGIQLLAKELKYWELEAGRRDIGDALCCCRRKVLPTNSDIIIGLIPDKSFNDSSYGMSTYYHGYLLVKYLESKELMKFALLHELCHIFGAVDICEIGSIMDRRVPIQNFDEFTTRVVQLNRNRSFHQDSFPLSGSQLDEAISLFKQRSELNRNEPDIHRLLALLYMEEDDLSSAEHACMNAIQFSPYSGQLHNILGNILRKQEQYDRALEEYQTALKNLAETPEIHFNMGEAYSKKGKIKNAISEYQKAIQLNPYYSRAHASLSHLCFKEKRFEQSIKQCRTALEFCPQHTELLCTLAASLIMQFDSLRKKIILTLDQETNGNAQTYSMDSTKDLDKESIIEEALLHSKKATEIAPNLSEAYNLSGVCYTYLNRFTEAERELIKALELKPDFVEAHYNLGYLYFQNKMMAKTAHHLKKIIESSYDSEVGIRLMERLFHTHSGCLVSPEQ